jgi:hypothetical protein
MNRGPEKRMAERAAKTDGFDTRITAEGVKAATLDKTANIATPLNFIISFKNSNQYPASL